MKHYVLNRLSEASTWRGIVALVTATGISLTPDQSAAITALGLALIGALGAFWPDKK